MTRTALAAPGEPDGPGDSLSQALMQAMAASYVVTRQPGSLRASQKVTRLTGEDVDGLCTMDVGGEAEDLIVLVKSLVSARSECPRYARVSPQWLTGLAVFIAGRKRAGLGVEWRSHLAGETGTGLPSRHQARAAVGFVIAAVRCRLEDAKDLAWRPVDAVLASRELSNLVALALMLAAAVVSIHGAGLYGLVSNLGNLAVVWGGVYGLIHVGRHWRDVKQPERKPRRRRQ